VAGAAWAITDGTCRSAVPAYYRDEAAQLLGVDRTGIRLVRWEYEVNVELADPVAADVGFVPARACVPIRPQPDEWQRLHQGFAGLFALRTFGELTALEHAVRGDASSEITLFGFNAGAKSDNTLAGALDQPSRLHLQEILRPGDVFVDLAVVRDRFLGHTSYLTVKTTEPIDDRPHRLAEHYGTAFSRYVNSVDDTHTFEDFRDAMDTLLAPPPDGAP
jgi:hypothetical protein